MRITRLTNSSTSARYQLQPENPLDAHALVQLGADALADLVDAHNYGGFIEQRKADSVTITVFLD